MIQQRTINGLTEIYVDGGGFLTESFPTCYHQFYKSKILTNKESVSYYKEVTSAEKTTLQKLSSLAKPTQAFVEEWNAYCIDHTASGNKVLGRYNENTNYFELHGILDITYEQALEIVNCRQMKQYGTIQGYVGGARTNLPYDIWYNGQLQAYQPFYGSVSLEVIYFCPETTYRNVIVGKDTIMNCTKLTKIIGRLRVPENYANNVLFPGCANIETAHFYINNADQFRSFNISQCPNFSLESLEWCVKEAYAESTTPITITLHPNVYARLTDELIEQAAAKKISFVTT